MQAAPTTASTDTAASGAPVDGICCICEDTAFTPPRMMSPYDNALQCPKCEQPTCLACLGRCLKPDLVNGKQVNKTGLRYRCPFCRENVLLIDKLLLLAIAKQSFTDALQEFPCVHSVAMWERGVPNSYLCDHDYTVPSVPRRRSARIAERGGNA